MFPLICTTCGISVASVWVAQINTGFLSVWLADRRLGQVGLIFATMALATVSGALGFGHGIKRLSEINIVLAMLLLLLILLTPNPPPFFGHAPNFGPIWGAWFPHQYVVMNPPTGLGVDDFHWGWWIAGRPFFGVFVARISWGERFGSSSWGTLVPTLFICLWMGGLGGSAPELIANQGFESWGGREPAVGLFPFRVPAPAEVLSVISLMMIVLLFTSADSGAMGPVVPRVQTPALPHAGTRVPWAPSLLCLAGGFQALKPQRLPVPPLRLPYRGLLGFWPGATADGAKRQSP
ncbi:MAG: hypothetical protein CM15mP103_12380 [Gammaproteobacteria bacterium]|nr:MAG: hypothetical protein CM15mP103_12380 [Gammaproteobacteria bacterium]